MRPYQLFLLFLLFLLSCRTVEDNFSTDLGHDYLALEMGKIIVYEVDSTIFDPTGDSLISYSHSFIRDIIVDTLLDNTGEVLYRTERFVRPDSTRPWTVQKVFTQSIQGNQGVVTEDNLRFIKLAFPIQVFNSWNPLVHIDTDLQIIVAGETLQPYRNGNWRTRILSADEPDTIGQLAFDNVLNLREADTSGESPFELRISYEKYARGVGLVYREQWILDSQKCVNDCQPIDDQFDACVNNCLQAMPLDTVQCEINCSDFNQQYLDCFEQCDALPWEEKAEKGFIVRMRIVSHN